MNEMFKPKIQVVIDNKDTFAYQIATDYGINKQIIALNKDIKVQFAKSLSEEQLLKTIKILCKALKDKGEK